jgi:glycosyltransferase involved in cell wall biosynthesis
MIRPDVSIVIPCYNAEEYVGAAIESALRQTHAPAEVIVINDGSEDGSLGVIQSFGNRITWRTGANRGACHARNWGLRLTSSPFIKFLDADDALVEDALETQLGQARKTVDERKIVFGDKICIDGAGTFLERVSYRGRREGEDPVACMLESNPQTSLPLHRRRLLMEVGGFDERLSYGQEYDLHVRLALAGVRFHYVPGEIALIRRHRGKERITNNDHFQNDPEDLLRRLQNRERMIREARSGTLSDGISRRLALDAWSGGRKALRRELPDVAQRYFDYARALHPQCVAGASRAYRWSVRLLGPAAAERMGTWARRTKTALS